MFKIFLTAVVMSGVALPVCAETLTVKFASVEAKGSVMIGVYKGEAEYTQGAPVKVQMVSASGGSVVATFEGLEPGTYGLKAFQDLNANGVMDKSSFGQPTEPYAFSNNAKGYMGPATWADAAFEIKGDTVQDLAF